MKHEIVPVVRAVAEYMPPKRNDFFQKSLDIIEVLCCNNPVSEIARTVSQAIQTFGMIRETGHRVKALEYVTHLEETRIKATMEMAKIQQSNAINLYIDQQFQIRLDQMERSYFAQSSSLAAYGERMIHAIDKRVESVHAGLDRLYIQTVKENEMKCAMYRDFLNKTAKEGVKQMDVYLFMARQMAKNFNKLDSQSIQAVCATIQDMMRYTPLIRFDEYIDLEHEVKKIEF